MSEADYCILVTESREDDADKEYCIVTGYYCIREEIGGVIVGGTDDPHEFMAGRDEVIKGWDMGVMSMKKKELSMFVIQPEYAYGLKGYPPKVRPEAVVRYEVELLSWKDALPRFPSKAEMVRYYDVV